MRVDSLRAEGPLATALDIGMSYGRVEIVKICECSEAAAAGPRLEYRIYRLVYFRGLLCLSYPRPQRRGKKLPNVLKELFLNGISPPFARSFFRYNFFSVIPSYLHSVA
mgnify:CR=1 FL=1